MCLVIFNVLEILSSLPVSTIPILSESILIKYRFSEEKFILWVIIKQESYGKTNSALTSTNRHVSVIHLPIISMTTRRSERFVWKIHLPTRSIQRTQTPPRLWPLTLWCDLDLSSRARKLMSLDVAFCIVPWYQVWCLWV